MVTAFIHLFFVALIEQCSLLCSVKDIILNLIQINFTKQKKEKEGTTEEKGNLREFFSCC